MSYSVTEDYRSLLLMTCQSKENNFTLICRTTGEGTGQLEHSVGCAVQYTFRCHVLIGFVIVVFFFWAENRGGDAAWLKMNSDFCLNSCLFWRSDILKLVILSCFVFVLNKRKRNVWNALKLRFNVEKEQLCCLTIEVHVIMICERAQTADESTFCWLPNVRVLRWKIQTAPELGVEARLSMSAGTPLLSSGLSGNTSLGKPKKKRKISLERHHWGANTSWKLHVETYM